MAKQDITVLSGYQRQGQLFRYHKTNQVHALSADTTGFMLAVAFEGSWVSRRTGTGGCQVRLQ